MTDTQSTGNFGTISETKLDNNVSELDNDVSNINKTVLNLIQEKHTGNDIFNNVSNKFPYFSNISDFLKQYPICINFSSSKNLDSLLKSEYYDNLFVTGVSNGTNNTKRRQNVEYSIFKYPFETPPIERPRYGYLGVYNEFSKTNCTGYGDCIFILQEYMKHYSTFTVGDTLDSHGNILPYNFEQCHYLVNRYLENLYDKGYNNISKYDVFTTLMQGKTFDYYYKKLKHYTQRQTEIPWDLFYYSYIEVQIHARIKLNRDIEKLLISIDLNTESKEKIYNFARKNNIPVEIYKTDIFLD